MKALDISNLKKIYPNGVEALKGINLAVEEGDFFALLGPNGAGKSTTIGIISSLVNKSSGTVSIFGYDLHDNLEMAKSFIGLVPQEFNFNMFEKVEDIIICQAGFYGIPRSEAKPRAELYLKQLGLWEKRHQTARSLSGGMKRRLMIARALIHRPKMLILDEPTAGVDIELRRSTWAFLKKLNQQGITIILTTHYLEEAEYLCKGIAIIDKGDIVENTSVKELLGRLNVETLLLDTKQEVFEIPKVEGYDISLEDSTTLQVNFEKSKSLNHLFEHLSEHGIEVSSMRNKSNRLEELFIDLVNKEGAA